MIFKSAVASVTCEWLSGCWLWPRLEAWDQLLFFVYLLYVRQKATRNVMIKLLSGESHD